MEAHSKTNWAILFYVPNLIGYIRLSLILAAHYMRDEKPTLAFVLYLTFGILDGIDGWAARKLNQCSAFGAWLDVVVDNVGRTMLWSCFKWGFLISNLEWITFIGNHRHGGAEWRETYWKDSFTKAPSYVKNVMANGFKTAYGILAIGGLHGLPLWLFAWEYNLFECLPQWLIYLGCVILVIGRVLCASVELWCVQLHIKCLLIDDHKQN